MDFNLEKVSTDRLYKAAEAEFAVESGVDGFSNGGKILSLAATSRILGAENLGDEAEISGRVNFKVMYANGDGELSNSDFYADFKEKLPISAEGKIAATATVVDTDSSISGTAKAVATVYVAVYALEKKSADCLVSTVDDFYTEKTAVFTQTYVGEIKETAELWEETQTRSQIEKVLFFDNSAVISEVKSGEGNALFIGKAYSTVAYLADGEIKTAIFKIPFSEEFENASYTLGARILAIAEVKNAKVVLGGVEGSNSIRVELTIEITAKVFCDSAAEAVTDVFSVDKELSITRGRLVAEYTTGTITCERKIDGAVLLESNAAPVRQLIDVIGARNSVASINKTSGSDVENGTINVLIEGILTANVVYRDEDGVNSVQAEIPYSETFELSGEIAKATDFYASGAVCDVYAKLKREREIGVTAELAFMITGTAVREYSVIAGIEDIGEKIKNNSALSVFFAQKGDGIWDAAKALSARPDDIKAQNPDIVFPFKGGEKVVFFRRA